MDDSDFEIEDSIEFTSLFAEDDAYLVLKTSVDWSQSMTTDTLLSDSEDDQLQSHEFDQEMLSKESVLSRLEEFAFNLVEQLQAEQLPVRLDLVRQRCRSRKHTMKWPTKSGSIRDIVRLFRVLEFVQEAIMCDLPITKREIFYRDVALFKNQRIVNSLVDIIAHTLEVPRNSLNVRASPKGLFCGSCLEIGLKRGETIQSNDSEGILIPTLEDISWLKVSESVAWVLVIEKEAIFQSLTKSLFASRTNPLGPGIMITGKGYPDFATLEFTKQLSIILPEWVPIGALMDGDPYGIEILSMYKYGGGTANREERFATSRIVWLGIWNSEVSRLGIRFRDNLLPLTTHDVKKSMKMLTQNSFDIPHQWKKELSWMLFNHKKAEIEILLSDSNIPSQNQDSAAQPGLSFLLHYLIMKLKDLLHQSAPN